MADIDLRSRNLRGVVPEDEAISRIPTSIVSIGLEQK
jgi:hypothetical protein